MKLSLVPRDLSLRTKLVALLTLLFATVAAFQLLFFPGRMEAQSRRAMTVRAQGSAVVLSRALRPAVEFNDAEYADQILQAFGSAPDTLYATLRRPDGSLLASWQPERAPAEAAVARERPVTRSRQDALDVVVAVRTTAGARGVLTIGYSLGRMEREMTTNRWVVAAVSAFVFLIGLAVGLLFTVVSVIRPIQELTRVTGDIVRRGDLTQTIGITSRDEIGQLAMSFSQMVEKLREIPRSLQESTQMLTASVSRLSSSASEQSQMITRQAAALQEAQVTVQEIKQTSLLAAQKAEAVLKVAERADEIGRSGERAIEESLGGLTDIRAQVEEIALKITGLIERTRQIGLITETVKDLADQSNMLALNAAIEAVRSGEHGKGFAVVAREIRSLADQSIQATHRVREILEDISSAIRSAVSITEKGSQKMEAGLVQVRSSGENLRELSRIVRENSAAVRQIAAAVSQQNAGITQIFAAVSSLNELMTDTVKRLEETNLSVEGLREVSTRVSNIVTSYRV